MKNMNKSYLNSKKVNSSGQPVYNSKNILLQFNDRECEYISVGVKFYV